MTVETAAPLHVALIMDGNGRWASQRGLPRAAGHRAGVQALKRTVEGAADCGVGCLTVFGFSTENWRRPAEEVSDLMGLVRSYVVSDLKRLTKAGVRLKVLGRRQGLPADIADIIRRAEADTAHNDRFLLQVAFNYGAQADIADAARTLAEAGRPIDENALSQALSTGEGPPVDVIVRTSGERRLSNFLLWEAAYAELVFQDVLWPDYGPEPLRRAVEEFRARDRRYGGLPDTPATRVAV
ncbi:MAG: polyprenyl diphosphate synthase [Brevundimonas sp.]|uniref:polyprenyl diphosphate synthase n=1 Tax=Brevundimonas sp. TaxID=1871086 RepID=UPI00391920AF